MKLWIANLLTGPIGVIIKPILAAIIGTLVGIGYADAWQWAYHYPWLASFMNQVIASLDPKLVESLTPKAIGFSVAAGVWGFGADWVISRLMSGNKAVQRAVNASDVPVTVAVDGIITKGGETVQAIKAIADTVTAQKVEYARQAANPKTH